MRIIDGGNHLDEVRLLIAEYLRFLDRDLSFQNTVAELDGLETRYSKPNGGLLVAVSDTGEVVGCVAYYRHNEKRCEMKRLFVKPAFQCHGIGRSLVGEIIKLARQDGYSEMVLDTIKPLQSAIHLYREFGFRDIPSYYHNPFEDVIYMGLDLN